MRLLLLADTHGFLDPRIAALAAGADLVVHAGDIGADQVLAELERHAAVVAVRGNNDLPGKWLGGEEHLANLPEESTLDLPGGRLVVVHGDRAGPLANRHRRLRREHPGARAVVYGHSHRLTLDTGEPVWVLNPGAAGRTRTYGGPSCILLTAAPGHWSVESRRFEPLAKPR